MAEPYVKQTESIFSKFDADDEFYNKIWLTYYYDKSRKVCYKICLKLVVRFFHFSLRLK